MSQFKCIKILRLSASRVGKSVAKGKNSIHFQCKITIINFVVSQTVRDILSVMHACICCMLYIVHLAKFICDEYLLTQMQCTYLLCCMQQKCYGKIFEMAYNESYNSNNSITNTLWQRQWHVTQPNTHSSEERVLAINLRNSVKWIQSH